MNYEISGKGHPLVFIHGLGGSISVWRRQLEFFDQNYTCLAYDIRGHGKTSTKTDPRFSLNLWSNDLVELLGLIHLEKPCLIGHSLGASIALKTYLERPDLVRGLVLLGASSKFDSAKSKEMTRKRIEAIEHGGMKNYVANWWDRNPPFAPGSQARIAIDYKDYRDMVLGCDSDAYIATCEALLQINLENGLEQVKCPTLIVTGETDDRTPVTEAEILNRNISLSTMKIVPKAGHSVMIEQPQIVNPLLETFFLSLFSV